MCSTPAVFFILSGSVSTCTSMFIVTVRGRTTTVEPSRAGRVLHAERLMPYGSKQHSMPEFVDTVQVTLASATVGATVHYTLGSTQLGQR